MTAQAPKKTMRDAVRELAALLTRDRLESPAVEAKIDELTNVARQEGALPLFQIALDAAKDGLEQVFGIMLGNLSACDRRSMKLRFEEAFTREFQRSAPYIKTR